jgi:DNA uptake protein ComE-like DNA-binding protein
MKNIITGIQSSYANFRRYPHLKYALVIVVINCVCLGVAGILLHIGLQPPPIPGTAENVPPAKTRALELTGATKNIVLIDISGAVEHPGVYELSGKSIRIDRALEVAGGLSASADKMYIARHVNFSSNCINGQKYYFPSLSERSSGLFPEVTGNSPILYGIDYPKDPKSHETLPSSQETSADSSKNSSKTQTTVSINSASKKQLDSLPGVGSKTIDAIISGRPYGSIDELRLRSIISDKLYDQLIPFLSL